MKYFIDTEFLEGTQKEKFPISLFRKNTPNTIDLISIGIVAEDGREYYAISKDFNLEEAWNRFDLKVNKHYPSGSEYYKEYWIRENVLKPIWRELYQKGYGVMYQIEIMSGAYDSQFTYSNFKKLLKKHGKTNKEISEEIISFTEPVDRFYSLDGDKRFTHGSVAVGNFESEDILSKSLKFHYPASKPEFYAYFADYDWVVFCWIFGKMMDLPKGFPMYCRDLKQILDEKANSYDDRFMNGNENFETKLSFIKNKDNYPKQENEHSAIHDARWNKKLHEFLNSL